MFPGNLDSEQSNPGITAMNLCSHPLERCGNYTPRFSFAIFSLFPIWNHQSANLFLQCLWLIELAVIDAVAVAQFVHEVPHSHPRHLVAKSCIAAALPCDGAAGIRKTKMDTNQEVPFKYRQETCENPSTPTSKPAVASIKPYVLLISFCTAERPSVLGFYVWRATLLTKVHFLSLMHALRRQWDGLCLEDLV